MKIYLNKRKNSSGQAFIEMCVALIGIMAVVLGVIFIAGIGINNVRALLNAKGNADRKALYANSREPAAGMSLYGWNYGDDEIPFTADDRPVRSFDRLDSFYPALNDRAYTGNAVFIPLSDLPHRGNRPGNSLESDFPESAFESALLVSGSPKLDNEYIVYTLDPKRTAGQITRSDLTALNRTFARLFGINPGRTDWDDLPANTVYMPALANDDTNK